MHALLVFNTQETTIVIDTTMDEIRSEDKRFGSGNGQRVR